MAKAKCSPKCYTIALVLALALPLVGVNFLMGIFQITMQYVLVPNNIAINPGILQNIQIFVPFFLVLVGLTFAIRSLVCRKDSAVLPILAIVLNSAFIINGLYWMVMEFLVA
ncbi:hypothetical protein HOF67_02540 [Candidatus Peregrinibacteria bacterium]|nr:hypothetical protein [Candidatus Peregrinibacteria bacterium]